MTETKMANVKWMFVLLVSSRIIMNVITSPNEMPQSIA